MEAQLTKRDTRFKPKHYHQSSPNSGNIDIDLILNEVANIMNIPVESFLGQSRKREYVTARQIAMVIACYYTNTRQVDIGEQIAGRNHSTVSHACKTINNLLNARDPLVMQYYPQLKSKFEKIRKYHLDNDPYEHTADHIFNTEK